MGLFTQGPRFDDETPGLPGEPLRPETAAERLPDAGVADAAAWNAGGTGIHSIAIPLDASTADAEAGDGD